MTPPLPPGSTPEAVALYDRARRRYYRGVAAVASLMSVLLVLILAAVLVQSAKNGATARTIKDCTTPTGACYQRNQAATRGVARELVTAIHNHELHSDARTRRLLARLQLACQP